MSRPSRRRSRWRTAALLATATLGLCCVGAAGLGLWTWQTVRGATGPARQAADEFLTDIAAGDGPAAYRRLCADTRARWTPTGTTQRINGPLAVRRYRIVDVSVRTRDGRPQATVTAELTRASGAVDTRHLLVLPDDGGWRVCGDPL
ncbi:MAG TPA: hypothetical protein VGD43_04540 [Micromonospora sp.]